MKLVFASNNAHKLDEVRAIMPSGVKVLSLKDVGFEHDIEENGTTLDENSRIKAETVCRWLINANQWEQLDGVFADDTGLEIDALNGAPGVFTARWAGSPAANRQKALASLAGQTNRACQFRTVITLLTPKEETLQVEGVVRGKIATEEHGEGGFGYDPIFIPEGYEKTFGELPATIKNSISHRARALTKLIQSYEFA